MVAALLLALAAANFPGRRGRRKRGSSATGLRARRNRFGRRTKRIKTDKTAKAVAPGPPGAMPRCPFRRPRPSLGNSVISRGHEASASVKRILLTPANGRASGRDRHRKAKTGNLSSKFVGFGRATCAKTLAPSDSPRSNTGRYSKGRKIVFRSCLTANSCIAFLPENLLARRVLHRSIQAPFIFRTIRPVARRSLRSRNARTACSNG